MRKNAGANCRGNGIAQEKKCGEIRGQSGMSNFTLLSTLPGDDVKSKNWLNKGISIVFGFFVFVKLSWHTKKNETCVRMIWEIRKTFALENLSLEDKGTQAQQIRRWK